MRFILIILLVTASPLVHAEFIRLLDHEGIGQAYLDDFDEVNLRHEAFDFYLPEGASEDQLVALFVYIHPNDTFAIPDDWKAFCDRNQVALLVPQSLGNNQPIDRRRGVSLLSTLKLLQTQPIDPERVTILGYSGGGRIASVLALGYPDIFSSCIGICGINFSREVTFTHTENPDRYGYFPFDMSKLPEAKARVKFVVITGPGDFRYEYLKRLVSAGYEQDGFQVTLFDLPAFKHQTAGGRELQLAYDAIYGSD